MEGQDAASGLWQAVLRLVRDQDMACAALCFSVAAQGLEGSQCKQPQRLVVNRESVLQEKGILKLTKRACSFQAVSSASGAASPWPGPRRLIDHVRVNLVSVCLQPLAASNSQPSCCWVSNQAHGRVLPCCAIKIIFVAFLLAAKCVRCQASRCFESSRPPACAP